MPGKLKLGAQIHGVGHGFGEWRHPQARADASIDFSYYREQAQCAEAHGFDFVFIADSLHIQERASPHHLNRFEPLTVLSALAACTRSIGLVGTVTVSYAEPFNVARQFASLDQISGGRAGWNVVTSWLSGTAANFGRARHPDHDIRYAIAQEHLDVVRGLWSSWDDDAFVRDKANGVFFRPGSLHPLNHEGEHFSVRGPLNIGRSPQGEPMIFQAGMSDEGRDFAARNADVVFCAPRNKAEAQRYYRDIKARAEKFGRDPSQIFVMPGIRPIVGADAADAKHRYETLAGLVTLDEALPLLGRLFNDFDFSAYPPATPFAQIDALPKDGLQLAREIQRNAIDDGLTLGQTALRVAAPDPTFAGTGAEVAATLADWADSEAADGFIVNAPLPDGLASFATHVPPALHALGCFDPAVDAKTLRARFGLPYRARSA